MYIKKLIFNNVLLTLSSPVMTYGIMLFICS